jgi:Spy/CpxP family protein refolding chaperone
MRRSLVVGVVMVVVALMVGPGTSQEKKPKGSLPANWKKLDLTKEQETKIRAIAANYQGKINALEKQIEDLKTQRRTDQVKVLTEEQKEKLRKILLGEKTKTPPTKDK